MNADVIALPIYRSVCEDLEVTHVVCCDDNYSLCAEDVTDDQWVPDEHPVTCPLCDAAPACFICGRRV